MSNFDKQILDQIINIINGCNGPLSRIFILDDITTSKDNSFYSIEEDSNVVINCIQQNIIANITFEIPLIYSEEAIIEDLFTMLKLACTASSTNLTGDDSAYQATLFSRSILNEDKKTIWKKHGDILSHVTRGGKPMSYMFHDWDDNIYHFTDIFSMIVKKDDKFGFIMINNVKKENII